MVFNSMIQTVGLYMLAANSEILSQTPKERVVTREMIEQGSNDSGYNKQALNFLIENLVKEEIREQFKEKMQGQYTHGDDHRGEYEEPGQVSQQGLILI